MSIDILRETVQQARPQEPSQVSFKKYLKEGAKQGIAFDRGEFNPDIHAIGAPIFDTDHITEQIGSSGND